MAKTPTEMATISAQLAKMYWDATKPAFEAGNYDLLASNLSAALDSHLMLGLLEWRHDLAMPRDSLAAVCEIARLGVHILEQLGPAQAHWRSFDVFPAAYCALLVKETVPIPAEEVLMNWQENSIDYLSQCLDACMLQMLRTGNSPLMWEHLMASLEDTPRFRLVRQTYANYADASLHASANPRAAFEAALKAIRLFEKRERDDYFAGGRGTDGGGPDNRHVVDYRWAALYHLAFADSLAGLDQGLRTHVWRW